MGKVARDETLQLLLKDETGKDISKKLKAIAEAISTGNAGTNPTVLDATWGAMVDGTNTTMLFTQWFPLAASLSEDATKYELLDRWFGIIGKAWGDKVYTLRWPYYTVSNGATDMTPMADLADKTKAILYTDTMPEQKDWTDEDPMTWYVRFNGLSLEDGTMNILAIEGIDGDFDITGNTAPVYTASIGLWRVHFTDGSYEYKTWATRKNGGMTPYASDVAPDGTHRNMHWEATFGGSLTSEGKLTSGAGKANTPNWRRAATTGLADARKWDAYEGLYSDTERTHLLDMWQLRHWNLENSGILEGCTRYNYQYVVALGEEDTKRVLITEAQAANMLVGTNVEVGSHPEGTKTDRNTAANYDLIPYAEITSIETVEIDGTTYAALNLDIAEAVTIPATAYVSTMPWTPGSTEGVPGHKDGCLGNLTNGKYPARIAGIEVIDGAYAIGLDPLWNSDYNADRSPKSIYTVYQCRDSEKQAGSITANYEEVATFQSENTSWQYIKEFDIRNDDMLVPIALGASGSTYMKSAFYFSGSSGVRPLWAFAHLNSGANAGLACAYGYSTPSYAIWDGRARLSGSGKKRGEWAA